MTVTNPNRHAGAFPREQYKGITMQEHAAIELKVPMSGNPWLDDMIRESRRLDFLQDVRFCMIAEAVSNPLEIHEGDDVVKKINTYWENIEQTAQMIAEIMVPPQEEGQ